MMLFEKKRLIESKAKCRHLLKLACKRTLRQVFIRVYRLEIQTVMLVFSTQLCELLVLLPSLWFNSPPFPVWISILYTRIQCVRGGGCMGASGPLTDKHLPQIPFTGQFFIWRHFALLSIYLSIYLSTPASNVVLFVLPRKFQPASEGVENESEQEQFFWPKNNYFRTFTNEYVHE